MAGFSIPTVLHIIGIFLLYKAKGELKNQRIITLNLAIAEVLICLLNVIILITSHLKTLLTSRYIVILHCLYASLFLTIRFAMLHIIIDRFLDIWLNIKYPIYMSSKNLRRIILGQWFLGFISSITTMLLTNYNIINKNAAGICRFYLDIIIMIAAILTFIYLLVTVKNIVHDNATHGREQNRTPNVWFKLKIPMLMVATFLLFNVSGSMWYFLDIRVSEYETPSYEVLNICGWISDSLIYIFLQKRVRRLLILKFCRREHERHTSNTQLSRVS